MNVVPMIMLWSISLLHSGATDYTPTLQPDPASALRRDASGSPSHLFLGSTHASCPSSPSCADFGGIQNEEDGPFEGETLNFGSLPHWVFGARTDLATYFPPPRRPGHSSGRTLPIRC
jgi:hypothetical protein